MKPRDQERLLAIITTIDKLTAKMTKHQIDYEKYLSDDLYKDSISMLMLTITEHASKLSTELKEAHGKIPWSEMTGMRNRFAHGYDGMDEDLIWEAATGDIQELKKYCQEILLPVANATKSDSPRPI